MKITLTTLFGILFVFSFNLHAQNPKIKTIYHKVWIKKVDNTKRVSGTLYVDSTNNRVGIGTTSPSDRLHIVGSNGSLRIDNTSSTKSFSMTVMDSNNRFRIYDNTSSAERLTITNGCL